MFVVIVSSIEFVVKVATVAISMPMSQNVNQHFRICRLMLSLFLVGLLLISIYDIYSHNFIICLVFVSNSPILFLSNQKVKKIYIMSIFLCFCGLLITQSIYQGLHRISVQKDLSFFSRPQ